LRSATTSMRFQISAAVLLRLQHFWDITPRTTNTRGVFSQNSECLTYKYLPKKCYDIQDEILIKMLMYVIATCSYMQLNLLGVIKVKRPYK